MNVRLIGAGKTTLLKVVVHCLERKSRLSWWLQWPRAGSRGKPSTRSLRSGNFRRGWLESGRIAGDRGISVSKIARSNGVGIISDGCVISKGKVIYGIFNLRR